MVLVSHRSPSGAHPAPTDAALVVAARGGESWASEALFRRHVGVVYGLACRLVGADHDADDVVQETFIAAFSSLERLRDPAAFGSWICGIAVRRTGKLLRKRRLLRRLGLHGGSAPDLERLFSSSAPPDVVAQLRATYAVVDRLPADLRVVLLLQRIEGATLDEIAAWTDSSLATVKRRLRKAEARFDALIAAVQR